MVDPAMARMQAEELVLREVILMEPEPETAETDDDQEDPNSMDLFVRLQNECGPSLNLRLKTSSTVQTGIDALVGTVTAWSAT
jgi:hypothetical protein